MAAEAFASGLLILMALSSSVKLTDQLRFEAIQIPSLVQRGTNLWLSCQFQLDPDQQLYSVKWYKNNEEFYRLLLSPPSSSSSVLNQELTNDLSMQSQNADPLNIQSKQQQYFTQTGVNVLMSSSNATHVRLLNASLESEGFYACEISTQNLSSIRYEREIRVYVLPQSRLSVIGFKSRYSMGDRIDLACASDYSRPRPALAWFINNQLIQDHHQQQQQQPAASSYFTLESQNRSKLNEPTLFKQTLSLKFKLTPELLRWILVGTSSSTIETGNRRNQSDQSRGGYQLGRIRLQCKYKLTEVSDLTFNELLLQQGNTFATVQTSPLVGRRLPTTDVVTTTDSVSVGKLPDNRLTQSKCPAKQIELQSGLFARRNYANPLAAGERNDECRLGQLALQPDDPLIVEAEDQTLQSPSNTSTHTSTESKDDDGSPSTLSEVPSEEDETERRRRRRRQVIGGGLSVGDVISVNCSTISSVLDALATSARRSEAICSDSEARRRSIISGKYQHTESESSAVANQRGHWTKQTGWSRGGQQQQQQQQQQSSGAKLVSQLMLTQRQLDLLLLQHDPTNKPSSSSRTTESTLSGMTLAAAAAAAGRGDTMASQLESPPLLEWFINNQEVPLGALASDGDTGGGQAVVEEPIDYVSYFANFDSKPIQRQLPLRLNLTKKHFMTPDSKLRLRCSSTQAQVLASESVALTLLPALIQPNEAAGQQQQVWQQKSSSSSNNKHIRKLLRPANLDGRSRLVAQLDNNSASAKLIATPNLLLLPLSAVMIISLGRQFHQQLNLAAL